MDGMKEVTFRNDPELDWVWPYLEERLRANPRFVVPSAADLDAVAEEQRIKEATSGFHLPPT